MRVSIVINTYNRGASLVKTLDALQYLDYEPFEVIVVNGPSTDTTKQVLAQYRDRIRVGDCPDVNISKSRNIGIAMAAGDVVAFIDDDAIPEPDWLREIVVAYDRPDVGGVGGAVLDYTGYRYQYRNAVCDRLGNARLDVPGPLWAYQMPGADPFIYLQGTNSSFRRDVLRQIGGFDEEIEYYLDETDVCLRVIDSGYEIRQLTGALVHHHFLPSHLRNTQRVLSHPYPVVKNKLYFSLLNGPSRYSDQEVLNDAQRLARRLRTDHIPRLDKPVQTVFLEELDRALAVGEERGRAGQRKLARFEDGPGHDTLFLPFPIIRPRGRKLTICFLSQDYPPALCGGIGRFTHDLAAALGRRGHEVHVITRGDDACRVDFEESVWVHRVPARPQGWEGLSGTPAVQKNVRQARDVYEEVRRISDSRRIDILESPIWDCEGLLCELDDDLTSVVSLQTTAKILADLNPTWCPPSDARVLVAMEGAMLRVSRAIHAISRAIWERMRGDYGLDFEGVDVGILPLGLSDQADRYPRQRSDTRTRVLFVGRLELRKGIDLLLEVIPALCAKHHEAEFWIVGEGSQRFEDGLTYQERFERATNRALTRQVVFQGALPDETLYQAYADADVFCAPSRYESFGLVLLEAMMFGLPIVASAVGGMTEVVRDGIDGLLVPPDDVGALTAALDRLLSEVETRCQMGASARRSFEERFTSERMTDRVERFYTQLIEA